MTSRNKKPTGKIRRFLRVLLIIVVIYCSYIALLFTGVIIESFKHGDRLDKESKVYIDRNVPVILSNWSKSELKSRADEAFLTTVSDKEIDDLLNYSSSTYGKLISYSGSEGESGISAHVWNFIPNVTRRAEYTVKAQFEKGPANIRVMLINRDGKWFIIGFFIKPL